MANTAVMISVVIPTLDAEPHLGRTLAALVPAAVDGLVREVIIADGGSRDGTLRIADLAGAEVVASPPGRGRQLMAGAERTRFPWLLFLHADTVLDPGWPEEARDFIARAEAGRMAPSAAVFRFVLDDVGFAPRIIEKGVALRTRLLGLTYGDQGLLISRPLYDAVGGFAELPLMEDVDLVRRLGRSRITVLRSRATTSAERYQAEGYARRALRNLGCLALYFLCVPPERIAERYAGPAGAGRIAP